jgi:hypothetical protein
MGGIVRKNMQTPGDKLVRAYIAGVIDATGNINAGVDKSDDYSIGFSYRVYLSVTKTDEKIINVLKEFCETLELEPTVRNYKGNLQFRISKRDDLEIFFREIQPYLYAKERDAEILLEEIIPGLNNHLHTTKEGMVELAEKTEAMPTQEGRSRKYNSERLRSELGISESNASDTE